jgi:hypothetical protein
MPQRKRSMFDPNRTRVDLRKVLENERAVGWLKRVAGYADAAQVCDGIFEIMGETIDPAFARTLIVHFGGIVQPPANITLQGCKAVQNRMLVEMVRQLRWEGVDDQEIVVRLGITNKRLQNLVKTYRIKPNGA